MQMKQASLNKRSHNTAISESSLDWDGKPLKVSMRKMEIRSKREEYLK